VNRTIALVACWLLSLSALAARAEEPLGVSLMRPDSLAGWEFGAQPPAGWTIAGGTLKGDKGSTPLLSGFTFGDFHLRFIWSVEDKAAWEILLPDVPAGPGLRLVLREGDGCGQLDDAGKSLASGESLPATGALHTAELRRAGDQLTLAIDLRQTVWTLKIAPGRRFGLGLAVTGGKARLTDLRAEEPPGEPIFDGRDLSGWWTPGDKSAWAAENGQIVLRKEGGNYLRTEKLYANYTLSLEYRIQKGGNSGVGIRTPRPGWPSGDGMEIQIWDIPYGTPLDKHAAGAIYGAVPPLARADKSGQFNRMVIKADGRMIAAWVNGDLVQQCHSGNHPELKHRHLTGWIGIQDHGARMEVRNIRVLEAPPGMGLDAWRKPPRVCGAPLVIDWLLNPEQLTLNDGARSATLAARVEGEKPEGHVLADLAGPGAVVRLARSSDDGHLEFYFDGERKPRLECRPAQLWQSAPQLAEDANPVLTYLAFRKGLKIVLRGANRGTWRVDYVTFPENVDLESYAAGDARIPRGWLAAAIYRHEQFGWGVHREYDPWPRLASGPKSLAPGQRLGPIRADGAGIVHWVRLTADKRVLETDDLWLEVRLDGRQEPSVATPVRFWFAGLAGEGNYPNYVLVDRGGVTNMLAMPFGAGIELSLVNRGRRPIHDVGLAVSLESATENNRSDIESRLRLKAVFEPAGADGGALAHCRGRGRWIGLVCEVPKGTAAGIQSLTIDDAAVGGWNTTDFDGFLGHGGDFRSCLSGRRGPLVWRYLLTGPVDFQESLRLAATGPALGGRLAVFYIQR
jgi:hypothetical protein